MIWPDEKLEKEMLATADRLMEQVNCPADDTDCACHVHALLQRVRDLEKELRDRTGVDL